MRARFGHRRRRLAPAAVLVACLVLVSAPIDGVRVGAALDPRARAAFEDYVARASVAFHRRIASADGLWALDAVDRQRALLAGDIVVAAGSGDGILDVPGGLIHHWKAAIFMPGVTVADVLAREREYARYPEIYTPVVQAELIDRVGNVDRIRLRLSQRTGFVGAVLDTWWTRRHGQPGPDRAWVESTADEIRQVEDAGTPNERVLPPGEGGGYLWMAASDSTLLERDGGTYAGFETIGLSRGFPRFLGWIAGPIARRIGRGSVERTLEELRASFTGEATKG